LDISIVLNNLYSLSILDSKTRLDKFYYVLLYMYFHNLVVEKEVKNTFVDSSFSSLPVLAQE